MEDRERYLEYTESSHVAIKPAWLMRAVRPDIPLLEQNGITGIALPRLDDPSVISLWFGEGDRVTPAFIREAAKNMAWMLHPLSCRLQVAKIRLSLLMVFPKRGQ